MVHQLYSESGDFADTGQYVLHRRGSYLYVCLRETGELCFARFMDRTSDLRNSSVLQDVLLFVQENVSSNEEVQMGRLT